MSETSENDRKSWLALLFRLFVLLSCAGTALFGILIFFSQTLFVAELLNNFRLQIGIAIFIVAIVASVAGLRKLALIQFSLGLVVLYSVVQTILPATQLPAGPQRISLLSYNVLGTNDDKGPILDLLTEKKADITVVIEYSGLWHSAMAPVRAANRYSFEAPRWHGFGIALFSQHPIENKQVVLLTREETDNPLLLAEIVIRNQRLILAAAHFLAPMSPERMELRNRQIVEASEFISDYQNGRDLPIIFVGDLNAVAWSPFIQPLLTKNRLRDSRQGYFYQASWPNDNLLLRIPIDNAFVSPTVHVHQRKLVDCYSSDHLPLFLEFSLSEALPSD